MILKALEAIEKSDIESFVANAASERRTLEYKLTLPGDTDAERKEFLADVSSFANAAGGDILYGVAATDGVPTQADGLSGVVADAVILKLGNAIRNGIAPRIAGVHIRTIDGFQHGPIVIIRIPKSWASPHMVTVRGTSRFFVRNNAGKHQMDIGEIRSAFALSDALPERIKNFRADRLGKIIAGETPIRLADAPKFVLHVLPLVAFSPDFLLAPGDIRKLQPSFGLINGGWETRFNIDGMISVGSNKGKSQGSIGYCQVFRNGIVESVTAGEVSVAESRKMIPSTSVEIDLIQATSKYLKALKGLEVSAPAVVTGAFLGIAGYELAVAQKYRLWDPFAIDRDQLIFPDVLAEDFEGDVKRLLRPLFDALWNAGGYERCMNYDEAGNYNASN